MATLLIYIQVPLITAGTINPKDNNPEQVICIISSNATDKCQWQHWIPQNRYPDVEHSV